MNKMILSALLALTTVGAEAQDKLYADEFPLSDVTLLDGPLKKARDLNIRVLMQYDNNRLLHLILKRQDSLPRDCRILTGTVLMDTSVVTI